MLSYNTVLVMCVYSKVWLFNVNTCQSNTTFQIQRKDRLNPSHKLSSTHSRFTFIWLRVAIQIVRNYFHLFSIEKIL